MAAPQITVLKAGEVSAPAAYTYGVRAFRGPGVRMPLLAFLIHHPRRGTILVDTGLHGDALTSLTSDYGRVSGTMLRGLHPAGEPFDAQLREAGVDPADIELVVMTHLHVDHTSGMRLLPRAKFVLDRREWEATRQPRASLAGYVAHHLPSRERVDTLELLPGQEHDLLGDGTVRLLPTPGHTRGHVSVHVETGSGPVLLAGDAVYTRRNLSENLLPLISVDRKAQLASMECLRGWQAEHPSGVLVPSHDPDAWQEL